MVQLVHLSFLRLELRALGCMAFLQQLKRHQLVLEIQLLLQILYLKLSVFQSHFGILQVRLTGLALHF